MKFKLFNGPGALIFAGILFGGALGASAFALLGETPTRWAAAMPRSEWLGFIGALLSAICTIAAGWLAWSAVGRQIRATEVERQRDVQRASDLILKFAEGARQRAQFILAAVENTHKIDASPNAISIVINLTPDIIEGIIEACEEDSNGVWPEDVDRAIHLLDIAHWLPVREMQKHERQLRVLADKLKKGVVGKPISEGEAVLALAAADFSLKALVYAANDVERSFLNME